jgi:hypothetical protein
MEYPTVLICRDSSTQQGTQGVVRVTSMQRGLLAFQVEVQNLSQHPGYSGESGTVPTITAFDYSIRGHSVLYSSVVVELP